MRIWVDADACPGAIRDILFRASQRTATELTLVANQLLRVPPGTTIRAVQVPAGFDVADDYIAARAEAGDLVVTADIPLAAAVIENGAQVLDPRGELLDRGNIAERVSMRDFMQQLRDGGVDTGGPAAFSNADKQAFAGRLDRWLATGGGKR